jgi:hypothetical protein
VLTSLSQKNEDKLVSAGAAAYFEKSALALDKGSDQLAAIVEAVFAQVESARKLAHVSKV